MWVDKAQSQTQLDVARKIQEGIVPGEYGLYSPGYEIFGCAHPAKEVGGDFYDVFKLDENRICTVVGDVSGKGISAALFMVMVKTSIREIIKAGGGIAEALNRVNDDICHSNPENMFATVFAAVLDTESGLVRFANAGHNPPLIVRDRSEYIEPDPGMALGLFEGADITEEEIRLFDGDAMIIYTDGVTEAVNSGKEQYGEERLRAVAENISIGGESINTAGELVNEIVRSVNTFAGEEEQFDDITCVALLFSARGASHDLNPDIASFRAVKQTMLSALGNNDHSREMILACEEIFANIVSYSGADKVSFSCRMDSYTYTVVFSDNGVPFDPVGGELKEKDFEELDTGGMGIMIARMNSREMSYVRNDGWNILTMNFDIEQGCCRRKEEQCG